MRLFFKEYPYLSAYPPNELDRILRNTSLGCKGQCYQFVEETETGYLCKPSGWQAGCHTCPNITVVVHKDISPTQVNLQFTLSQMDKVYIWTTYIFWLLVSVALLFLSPSPNDLLLIPALFIVIFLIHRLFFNNGIRTYRKIFIQQLRLQKSATPKEK